MVGLGHAVDHSGYADLAGLELQREELGVVAGLVQIASVEPERILLGRLPHVALLPHPGSGVLSGVRAESPALADLVGDLLRYEARRPAIHRPVTGGQHDEIGIKFAAVGKHHGGRPDLSDADAASQLHTAVNDEIARAYVDVVARATAQVFHE